VKLYITHSKWSSPDHFEALGCEDTYPNMVIRFDFTTENGWKKWRHGGWLPINLDEVPTEVMVRYQQRGGNNEKNGSSGKCVC
jgi:hypothetical protein